MAVSQSANNIWDMAEASFSQTAVNRTKRSRRFVATKRLLSAVTLTLVMFGAGSTASPSEQQNDAPDNDSPTPLAVFTYHDKPPYYSEIHRESDHHNARLSTQQAEGLYPAFVDLMNDAQHLWRLELKHLPRKRLQLQLQQQQLQGVVIGVHPIWFGDRAKTKYLWSQPIMHDRDVIAVRGNHNIQFEQLEDLHGLTFAVPRGWYFAGISEMIDAGKIKGFETSSDIQNLKMIVQRRVDATVISMPTLQHFKKRLFCRDELKALAKPHDEFTRQILFPHNQTKAYKQLADIIHTVSQSPAWRHILHAYGIPAGSHTQTEMTSLCRKKPQRFTAAPLVRKHRGAI